MSNSKGLIHHFFPDKVETSSKCFVQEWNCTIRNAILSAGVIFTSSTVIMARLKYSTSALPFFRWTIWVFFYTKKIHLHALYVLFSFNRTNVQVRLANSVSFSYCIVSFWCGIYRVFSVQVGCRKIRMEIVDREIRMETREKGGTLGNQWSRKIRKDYLMLKVVK